MSEIALVAMRLKDMWKMHPDQVEGPCSKCGQIVGIYPSGQKVLAAHPEAKILCAVCAIASARRRGYGAGSWAEISREMRDSRDVGKA